MSRTISLRRLRDASLIFVITLGLIEVALRVAPGMVPLALLSKFTADTRHEIAERRDIPTLRDAVVLSRDDGGPPVRLFRPFQKIANEFTDEGSVNEVVMDSNGFCNAPGVAENLKQAHVVALGDSFTWCTTVRPEETWSNQLTSLGTFDVYNLGLPGVGVYEYVQLLKTFGLALRPERVLLNYYGGNDLRDAAAYRRYLDAGPAQRGETSRDDPIETPILRDSYAINLLVAAAAQVCGRIERLWTDDAARRPLVNFRYRFVLPGRDPAPFNVENTDLDEVGHAKALRDGRITLGVLDEGLRSFVALADEHGFEPIVSYTPSAFVAYEEHVRFEDRRTGELVVWFDRVQRVYLAERASELGYRFIDFAPALQEAARTRRGHAWLYFPTNVHLSQLGHRVIGEHLAEAQLGAPGYIE